MGITDQNWAKLSCPRCSSSESIRATQHGSSYSEGSWSAFSDATRFEVKTKKGSDGPEVASATCLKCKGKAEVQNGTGFNVP